MSEEQKQNLEAFKAKLAMDRAAKDALNRRNLDLKKARNAQWQADAEKAKQK